MRDEELRGAILRDLREAHAQDPNTLIIEELGLCQGTARIDVGVINEHLVGYEIKSHADKLARLPYQLSIYCRCLDRLSIVTEDRHIRAVRKLAPMWVGICVATKSDCYVHLEVDRPPLDNPALDPNSVVQLLWRGEAIEILKRNGLEKGVLSKAREIVWQRLADSTSLNELRYAVTTTLRARHAWPSDPRRM